MKLKKVKVTNSLWFNKNTRARKIASTLMASAAAEEKDLVEILDASYGPIDTIRYVDFVRDPAAGAIATFEGTTRDTFEGKSVVELRYEAYVPMAARRLAAVCAEARASWPLLRLAVAHRLGTVGVGEASVFVAASAVHRAEAMEACRYVIDEVKASVPIWKKEVYENGEVWKENREFRERMLLHHEHGPAQKHNQTSNGCCGSKVKVDGADHRTKEEDEATTV